jgi:serine/threonine protein kinase
MDFVGQTLDGKYRIERELGRGGMGTVYLATHLGTERPVAVKIISPQYMERAEFVERFRREARAAGRLRHPNVVNVTDFGFSESKDGQVAYLVMEYLDGCTLGEVLDEEQNLPVGWTLDIIEQVCSAVHEAHEQGIIHRDLKPDNIWLEPNQRGGYTVKVLDFGIAKLEEHVDASEVEAPEVFLRSSHTVAAGKQTASGIAIDGTMLEDHAGSTRIADAVTIAQTDASGATAVRPRSDPGGSKRYSIADDKTAVFPSGLTGDQDTVGTKLISSEDHFPGRTVEHSLYESSSADLTRVGAVLGTPLYMSPEQCRGEHLDARSDIYSLGVIAYQMLSGRTPFEGNFKDVMEAHKAFAPPPLAVKKVRRKMGLAIDAALSKDPDARPQTAEAFSSNLRSRSEGIIGLLRRALVIYSEHLPKYLLLAGFFSIPIIVLTLTLLLLQFLKAGDAVSSTAANVGIGLDGFALTIASAFCTNLIVGSISWIVIQYLAVPLRPVRLRPALKEARRKWKRVAGAGFLTALMPFLFAGVCSIAGCVTIGSILGLLYPLTKSGVSVAIGAVVGGLVFGFLGFFVSYILFILVPPVVMLENVAVFEALKRSAGLVKRSFLTSIGAVVIMLLIPGIIAGGISFVVNISAKAFESKSKDPVAVTQPADENATPVAAEPQKEENESWNWSFNRRGVAGKSKEKQDVGSRLRTTFFESLIQIFWLPMQILVFSFSAIIVALLYLKTRLAGGEAMKDLIERFEDDGRPRKKWQERVRQRLIQSGRIPSSSS